MLVLCSNGLSNANLLDYISKKTIHCRKAALVVTADHEYKEKNYHVPRCVQELESLNLSVDLFDLDTQSASQLLDYDVVEFIGGNPFYLLHCLRLQNAAEILHTLASDKILIGWSAAAFVFGPSLELVNMYSPEMNLWGLSDLTAMELTDITVLPHYQKFLSKFDQFEEKCRYYEISHNTKVVRLNDGDGLFIEQEVSGDRITSCEE